MVACTFVRRLGGLKLKSLVIKELFVVEGSNPEEPHNFSYIFHRLRVGYDGDREDRNHFLG